MCEYADSFNARWLDNLDEEESDGGGKKLFRKQHLVTLETSDVLCSVNLSKDEKRKVWTLSEEEVGRMEEAAAKLEQAKGDSGASTSTSKKGRGKKRPREEEEARGPVRRSRRINKDDVESGEKKRRGGLKRKRDDDDDDKAGQVKEKEVRRPMPKKGRRSSGERLTKEDAKEEEIGGDLKKDESQEEKREAANKQKGMSYTLLYQ